MSPPAFKNSTAKVSRSRCAPQGVMPAALKIVWNLRSHFCACDFAVRRRLSQKKYFGSEQVWLRNASATNVGNFTFTYSPVFFL